MLCKTDYGNWLFVPLVFLVLNVGTCCYFALFHPLIPVTVSTFATIGIRITTFFFFQDPGAEKRLNTALDAFQISTLTWSLLTNLLATCIIAHKAWSGPSNIFDWSLGLTSLSGDIDRQSGRAWGTCVARARRLKESSLFSWSRASYTSYPQ